MFKVNEILIATRGRLKSGEKDTACRGISIDSRTIKPQEAFLAIKGDNFNGHDFIGQAMRKGARIIIGQAQGNAIKPQNRTAFIEVNDPVRALGDLARFNREKHDIPVIAVTGSNGKTTAKEMIAWVLSKKFKVLKNSGTKNNQIGLPLALLGLDGSYDLAVVEAGTNHFGEIDYLTRICQPDLGVITNIGPSHLEHFGNLEGVFKEKSSLINNLRKPGISLLNADDSYLKKEINRVNNALLSLSFGLKHRSDFFAFHIRRSARGLKFLVNQKYRFTPLDKRSKIKGSHRRPTEFTLNTLGYYNVYNALAAVAVGRIFGLGYKDLAERLAVFDFPQNRLQLLQLNNVKFINDAYNSNPLSLKQALDALKNYSVKGRKIFIMGDMLELGRQAALFHRQAGKEAARVIDVFITVGRLSKFAAEAARKKGLEKRHIFTCADNLEAQDILFNKINPRPQDIVLVKGSRAMVLEEIIKRQKTKVKSQK